MKQGLVKLYPPAPTLPVEIPLKYIKNCFHLFPYIVDIYYNSSKLPTKYIIPN